MDNRDNMISRYLDELSAKDKTNTFEELEIRLRSIKLIRNILNGLKQQDIGYTELTQSYLEDENILKPDFIVHTENVYIPLYIKYYVKETNYDISIDELTLYKNYLKSSNYLKMIISWMVPPNFPSIQYTIYEITDILQNHIEIKKEILNLNEMVINVISKEFLILPVISPELSKSFKPENMMDLLISSCKNTFKSELKRKRPRKPYKVNGLNNINNKDIENICFYLEQFFMNKINQDELMQNIKVIASIHKSDDKNDNIN